MYCDTTSDNHLCVKCWKYFSNKADYLAHNKVCKGEILTKEEKNLNFCYCCPECAYKSENVNLFQIHALQNHPLSLSFFMRENTNSDSGNS